MTDTPFSGSDVTVTIKRGPDYGAPWDVFRGSPQGIKAQMIEYYGLDSEALADADPATVEMEALQTARAAYLVADQLDGKVISTNKSKPSSKAKKSPSKPKAESKAEPKDESSDSAPTDESVDVASEDAGESEDPLAAIRAEIAQTTDPGDLNKLWAKNQQAFANGDLLDEWKARGRELVGASK